MTSVTVSIAIALFFVVYTVAVRKHWLLRMPSLVRFLTLLTPLAAIAAVVLSQVRLQTDLFQRCLVSTDFSHTLVLGTLEPWMQGLIFGLAPVVALAFVIQIIVGIVRN